MEKKKIGKKKIFLIASAVILALAILLSSLICIINVSMIATVSKAVFSSEAELCDDKYDCILVLGAGIRNGAPSDMLRDRLLTAIDLYSKGYAEKLLMSGDHEFDDYDEVGVMKSFAIEKGVDAEDIFSDHYGLSTYDSIYRAKEIFGVDKIIIVTQRYHLYRALYISERLNVEAVGVCSDTRQYKGALWRGFRETAARTKDFFKCFALPPAKYGGTSTSIDGNGNITDKR